jgi:hypothetical protein
MRSILHTLRITVLVASTNAACNPVPPSNPPKTAASERIDGYQFCKNVESSARLNAIDHRDSAWLLGGFALVLAGTDVGIAATEQPADNNPGGKNAYKAALVTLPLAASLFAYFASGQFDFAANSTNLASAAANAQNLKNEEDANDACNGALSSWDSGGTAASAAFANAVAAKASAPTASSTNHTPPDVPTTASAGSTAPAGPVVPPHVPH